MLDSATETKIVLAEPVHCFDIATDFEKYPEWAPDVKQAVIRGRDKDGRPLLVEFRASALGRSTHYTLRYDYSDAPRTISWHLEQGDIMRTIDGSYQFESSGDTSGSTKVIYTLAIELLVPLPGFIKRRAEGRILHTLQDFKARCEL